MDFYKIIFLAFSSQFRKNNSNLREFFHEYINFRPSPGL